ncbi:type III-A CRISPR-associated RAMP protein Csm4 [Methylotuvimicrobium sp.]|uniref:type III-A CRISPR-associated RAMP protein Csm4 n=1 Tax=Methylotuvimicrobium sp. TaxID=2822413 RepID=UPI003D645E64
MQCFSVTLTPLSAFATPLKGDTLFGQLCWAIRNRFGEASLTELLNGYTEGRPFAVASDAFPQGYLPLPKLPFSYYRPIDGTDRKAVKKRCWLAEAEIEKPVSEWLGLAKTAADIAGDFGKLSEKHPQPHNTIDRRSNTTGEGGFAPYSIEQEWFIPGLRWHIYVLLDTERLSAEDYQNCLTDIGEFGFGRDASIGLGKFKLEAFQAAELPSQADANSSLTLAPCAPQRMGFAPERSYYQLFTRFGRHGDIAVHQAGKPFKNPILLAQTAALMATMPSASGFIGQGIGGNGELSKTLPATVHQGYAPVIAVNFQAKECS